MSKISDEKIIDLDEVIREIGKLAKMHVIVGPAGKPESNIAAIAAVHEYGATIKPKKGKYLAVPAHPAAKGKSPREWSDLHFKPNKKGGGTLSQADGTVMYILVKQVKIPERAFMRKTFASAAAINKVNRIAKDAVARILTGKGTARNAADACGASLSASVRSTITKGLTPPNSPLTLALKRGSLPLYDEGYLHKSISWEVV